MLATLCIKINPGEFDITHWHIQVFKLFTEAYLKEKILRNIWKLSTGLELFGWLNLQTRIFLVLSRDWWRQCPEAGLFFHQNNWRTAVSLWKWDCAQGLGALRFHRLEKGKSQGPKSLWVGSPEVWKWWIMWSEAPTGVIEMNDKQR